MELFAELERNKARKNRSHLLRHLPKTMSESDEHQYCNKNVLTPRATNFTSSTQGLYKLGGDNVVHIVDLMLYSCHF